MVNILVIQYNEARKILQNKGFNKNIDDYQSLIPILTVQFLPFYIFYYFYILNIALNKHFKNILWFHSFQTRIWVE